MNAALVLTAIFNGACQGAVLCGIASAAFRVARRLNATTMFAVWSVLLVICVVLPFANLAFAPRTYTVHVYPVKPSAEKNTVRLAPVSLAVAPEPKTAPQSTLLPAAAPSINWSALFERAVPVVRFVLDRASVLLAILGGIALLRLAVLARDLLHMLAARRRVREIDAPVHVAQPPSRPFKFVSSREFTSPCVLGFSPALIVIPEDLLDGSRGELLSVVLHESEHVRRFDDIQNVIQRFIGAIAFFLPGVRMAIRELALYREQICDDAAVNGTGDAVSYAMTLTGMAQWATGRGAPVPSLIFKRKQLVHRLEVLLDSAVNHSLRTNRRFAFSAAIVLALAAGIVLRVQMPVVAESIVQPKVPQAPKAPAAPKSVPKVPQAAPLPPKRAFAAPNAIGVAPKAIPAVPAVTEVPKRTSIAPKAPAKPQALRATPCPFDDKNVRVNAYAVAPLPPIRVQPAVAFAGLSAAQHRLEAAAAVIAPAAPRTPAASGSSDLLDALDAAGIHNLSVDQLIAIRDHGVRPVLVRSAMQYFGTNFTTKDLTELADHGVTPEYLDTLRANGITGIAPSTVWMLMDHGVNPTLVRAADAYFHPVPSPADLVYLADHGVTSSLLDSFRNAGVTGVPVGDVVRLMDHGVPAPYISKVRRMNPRATIDDVIRLHDAGV